MFPVLSYKPARLNIFAAFVCFVMASLLFTAIVRAETPSFQTFADPVINVSAQAAPVDVESLTFETFCKVPAVVGAMPVSFETFSNHSETSGTQVLLFGAKWCRACKGAEEHVVPWLKKSGWNVTEVDFDTHASLVAKHEVKLLPTYVVVFEGKEYGRAEGFDYSNPKRDLDRLNKMIQKANQSYRSAAR